MDNIELFQDLLHGKLDEDAERSLFSEMSLDDGLRTDFKCFAAVTSGIRQNMHDYAPSSALKSSIYSKAGFSMPAASAGTAAAASSITPGFFGSKLFISLATGVASSVSAVLITMLLMSGNVRDINKEPAKYDDVSKPGQIIPKIDSRSLETFKPEKIVVRYVYVNQSQNEFISQDEVSNQIKDLQSDTKLSRSDVILNRPINLIGNVNRISPVLISGYDGPGNDLAASPADKLGIEAELNGSISWNIPHHTIDPAEYNRFNNMDISIFLMPIDGLRAGINLRQETYYTVYQGTEADGSVYKYYQQPNLTTFSLVGRYTPFSFYSLAPFIQLGAGFNRGGYVANPSVGLEMMAYTDLSFILSGEYGIFWFSHQGSWYTAEKAGIKYGISYKF